MIKYNEGLGFLPISNFIPCDIKGFNYKETYNDIVSEECFDIILHGVVPENLEEVRWLIPRLIAESYIVSVVNPDLLDILTSRLLIPVDLHIAKRHITKLSELSEKDLIVIREDTIGKLFLASTLLFKETRAAIAFDTKLIDKQEVLARKLYDINPVIW